MPGLRAGFPYHLVPDPTLTSHCSLPKYHPYVRSGVSPLCAHQVYSAAAAVRHPMSPYAVLGVDRDATFSEIRKAYRKQALLNHPDKNPDDAAAESRFLKVTLAYEVLSDVDKRSRYDDGEGDDSLLFEGRDLDSASDLFNEHFGQGLLRQWRPGVSVSGIRIADGKQHSITIRPDGTTEEKEFEVAEREHGDGCGDGCGHPHCASERFMSVTHLEEVHTTEGAPLAELELSSPATSSPHSTCSFRQLEHEPPPPMPAGYSVGMQVCFTGPSFRASSHNWLVQGAQGMVVGPATSNAFKGKGVAVQFPKNRTAVECDLNELSRSREPPAPPTFFSPGMEGAEGRTGQGGVNESLLYA